MMLALDLGADFITAYASAQTFPEYQEKLGGRLKCLTENIVTTRGLRFFWLRWLFFKNRSLLKQYDVLIASSQAATEAVGFYAQLKALKMVYTHTTPRRIFDMYAIKNKGIRGICSQLNEQGITNNNGNSFSFSTIKGIII